MKKIHPNQQALLKLLRDNVDDPLTIRELQETLQISSPSVVQHHIEQLEKKGYLKRNPSNPRDYQILSDPEKPIVYLNLYGLAHCGPKGLILDGNPIDRIPIASRLINFAVDEAFLVEAKGDSMEPKIKAGDLIIAQRKRVANNGDMIVCVNKSKALIKTYHKHKDGIILQSANENKYPPILADKTNFRIEGIVKGIIHYN